MLISVVKLHKSGILKGTTTKSVMDFKSWDIACEWATIITCKKNFPYTIVSIVDLSGELK